MEARSAARRQNEVPDALLLLEHPPVLTLGRRGDQGHILATPSELEALGIDVFHAGRGGDVTYHGPGQVVGYPILSLEPDRRDVRRYVSDLEGIMIDVCGSFGLVADRSPGQIGCWVGERSRKIGAVGVRISRWVTTHGFALNVDPDPAHFRAIVPCGIADKPVTSLARELGFAPPIEDVMDRCEVHFLARFGDRPA